MAWIKSAPTYNGFEAYTETDSYGEGAFTKTSALPKTVGGSVIVGTQTGSTGTEDSGTSVMLQISLDGTNWHTIKTATTVALGDSRAFSFDCSGIFAPYFRFYSPLTTHTGDDCTWGYSIYNNKN